MVSVQGRAVTTARNVVYVVGALCFAVGALSMTVYREVSVDRRVPTVIERVEVVNSPVPAGKKLTVRITRQKVRGDCPVTSIRYVTDIHGRAFNLPDAVWAGGPPKTAYVDLDYDTSGLPPGDYTLHVDLLYSCPGMAFPVPPVEFTVAAGKE